MPRTGKDIMDRLGRSAALAGGFLAIVWGNPMAAAQETADGAPDVEPGVRVSMPGGSFYTNADLTGSPVVTSTGTHSEPEAGSPVRASREATSTRSTTTAGGVILASSTAQRPRAVKEEEPRQRAVGGGWVPNQEGTDGTNLGTSRGGTAPPSPDGFQVIPAGAGFTGPTPQPGPMGNPSVLGYSARAIARWDVVPFQTISSPFHIGVLAFHVNGIDRVEFSLDGGAWVAVHEPQLNPRTNVEEYTVVVDPATMTDGPCEIRAVVWPNVGEPRVLQGNLDGTDEPIERHGQYSMYLTANSGGTQGGVSFYVSPSGSDSGGSGTRSSPFATIGRAVQAVSSARNGEGDGSTIYLLPGTYANSSVSISTLNQWLTICAPDDVDPSQVRIVSRSGEGVRTKRLHWRRVTVHPSDGLIPFPSARGEMRSYWLSNCTLEGTGRLSNPEWIVPGGQRYAGVFVTDTTATESANGIIRSSLLRNVHYDGVASDVFSLAKLVINCSVRDVDHYNTGAHADVAQYPIGSDINNVIFYRTVATDSVSAQGFFHTGVLQDFAIVDCHFNNQPFPTARTICSFAEVTNVYVKGTLFEGPARWNGTGRTTVVFEGTTFDTRYNDHPFMVNADDPTLEPNVVYR